MGYSPPPQASTVQESELSGSEGELEEESFSKLTLECGAGGHVNPLYSAPPFTGEEEEEDYFAERQSSGATREDDAAASPAGEGDGPALAHDLSGRWDTDSRLEIQVTGGRVQWLSLPTDASTGRCPSARFTEKQSLVVDGAQEAMNRRNIPLQEKFHRAVLRGLRNISETP